MDGENLQCPECGKHFGSRETLEEHAELEHSGTVSIDQQEPGIEIEIPDIRQFLNQSFALGVVLGILISGIAFSGFMYWQSLDHRPEVPITVVTCDNCSYEGFQTATDRMFNTRYREVNYQSQEGQELIQKYDLSYVPGFIFDKKVEETENFTRVRSALVEFDDAYVIPDTETETAQRLSEGIDLE